MSGEGVEEMSAHGERASERAREREKWERVWMHVRGGWLRLPVISSLWDKHALDTARQHIRNTFYKKKTFYMRCLYEVPVHARALTRHGNTQAR